MYEYERMSQKFSDEEMTKVWTECLLKDTGNNNQTYFSRHTACEKIVEARKEIERLKELVAYFKELKRFQF